MRKKTRERLLGEVAELISKQRMDAVRIAKDANEKIEYWKNTTPERELRKMQRGELKYLVVVSEISGFSLSDLIRAGAFLVVDKESEFYGKIGIYGPGYGIKDGERTRIITLNEAQVYESRSLEMIMGERNRRLERDGQIRVF